MHPYEDYRDSHASLSSQGGGVINCLSHMFDLAYWLFGYPQSLISVGGKNSALDLDVEDVADTTLIYKQSGHVRPVHIHLDFLQKPSRIYTHVVCDQGVAHLDFISNNLSIDHNDGTHIVYEYPKFQRNNMFSEEINDFLVACKTGTKSPIPIEEGIKVLDMCLAAKQSLQNQAVISLP